MEQPIRFEAGVETTVIQNEASGGLECGFAAFQPEFGIGPDPAEALGRGGANDDE